MSHHSDRFGVAMSVLAGHGHIKTRLIEAFDDTLTDIDDALLPDCARPSFSELKKRMTRVAPLNGEGSVRATVRKMSIPEADECAHLLVAVYESLLKSVDTELPEDESVEPVAVPAVLLKSV